MIFQLDTEGNIIDWDVADIETKDAIINALELARHNYIWKTRRIFNSIESAKGCDKRIQELMTHIGQKCKSHDTIGIFKGVEETWEDYYYIIEQPYQHKVYNTMVDSIEFID